MHPLLLALVALLVTHLASAQTNSGALSRDTLKSAEQLIGLDFSDPNEKVDLFLAPSLSGRSLLLSNLTGHPSVVVPNGFTKAGTPTSICFIGKLFGEAELLVAAKAYQDATGWHRKHPQLEKP